ncbi:MAG: hypothetical protein PF572_03270 [Patescibacteria group bacterium]|jgi:hypothetical protein|nr:hypothetical protein [Patescibacteria group bacterium]
MAENLSKKNTPKEENKDKVKKVNQEAGEANLGRSEAGKSGLSPKSSSSDIQKIFNSPVPISDPNKKKSRINIERYNVEIPLSESEIEPIWVSVTEAAKFGGVQGKTIRRAIQANLISYKVINDRYQIDFGSVVRYLYTSTKLKNKITKEGVGKYIDKWKS